MSHCSCGPCACKTGKPVLVFSLIFPRPIIDRLSQLFTRCVGELISFMNIHEKRLFLWMEVSSDTELSLTDTKNKGSALQHQETNCVSYNFLITSKRKLLQVPFRRIGVLCTLNEKPGHQIFFWNLHPFFLKTLQHRACSFLGTEGVNDISAECSKWKGLEVWMRVHGRGGALVSRMLPFAWCIGIAFVSFCLLVGVEMVYVWCVLGWLMSSVTSSTNFVTQIL